MHSPLKARDLRGHLISLRPKSYASDSGTVLDSVNCIDRKETTMKRQFAVLAVLITTGCAAVMAGQDGKDVPIQQGPRPVSPDEWQVTFTPYGWLPSVDLNISTPDIRIGNRVIGGDFSVQEPWWETISKFSNDFYVLSLDARLEAWKGRWGGFIDGYWIFGKSTVGGSDSRLFLRDRVDVTASSSVTSRFDTGQISFGPQFKLGTAPLGENCSVSFIPYGGGRINWIGNDIDGTLTIRASANVGEIGQTFKFSSNSDRVIAEPMIGFKTSWAFGEKVEGVLRGDVGGFGVVEADNWDCDLEVAIAWRAWRNTYLDFGYRARGQWQDEGSNGNGKVSGWYFGPELGLTFRF